MRKRTCTRKARSKGGTKEIEQVKTTRTDVKKRHNENLKSPEKAAAL